MLDFEEEGGSPLFGMRCPISYDVMIEPMMLVETGQSYEKREILSWLSAHNTCPLSGQVLTSKALAPNYSLMKAIQDWRSRPMRVGLAQCHTGSSCFRTERGWLADFLHCVQCTMTHFSAALHRSICMLVHPL